MRDARLAKQWTVEALARKAGVSRDLVYAVERGEPSSLEALARLAAALGLRLEVDLMDPRRTREPPNKWSDPVHSAMGEFEAAHLRPFGIKVGMAEPYQHFQFAGRGDLVAWDMPGGAFLHIENRTRFPNFQETAGSFNAKRAYLAPAIAERLGVRRWSCQTHVLAALWSSETLHVLRLRPESFRALCPDPSSVFGIGGPEVRREQGQLRRSS